MGAITPTTYCVREGSKTMTPIEIREALFQLRDEEYRAFQAKLIPTVNPDAIIGVRTPALRGLAKQLYRANEAEAFLADLPHRYYDENQLHAFVLSETRDFECCVGEVCRFLPFVDNWATCDQLSPKAFKKHRHRLPEYVRRWLASGHVYTVRFAIGVLMTHFLDEDFKPEYLDWVARTCSDEYYINMMVAWYFATALAKQYESALPYIEGCRLDPWTHNKTIQKCVESYRIPMDRKEVLKSLRLRKGR